MFPPERPAAQRHEPLAARMRPRTLDEFAGQQHIVGHGRLLRRAIQADQLSSLILYGPPGTGKTTLAMIIANTTSSHFETLNAVLAGVAEIRRVTAEAQKRLAQGGQRTTLFVDEVHRWNRAQQDALLPWVENGTVIFIGATTENPYFSVNRPLVSRSHVFQLQTLREEDLRQLALRALADRERGYGAMAVEVSDEALAHIVDIANGDARGVLNALEIAVETTPPDASGRRLVDLSVAEESIQRRAVLYDREGDVHYDTISAFIKSMRGSDPDATMYWLAKMVYAGEDPDYIFRRMLIFAGEDVGLADPQALIYVQAAAQAFDRVGLPEGRYHLAEAALYLATAPKSNSSMGFFDALSSVERERADEVPNHLRDASRDREGFGHGQGYLYPHAYTDHWVNQQYLPDNLRGRVFYQPSDQGYESGLAQEVQRRREAQLAAASDDTLLSIGEVLTTSPQDRGSERWLQRALSGTGGQLAAVRDRLMEAARLQRHEVALDLAAGTGLLTFELLRRLPEGGVWALARSDAEASELIGQVASLPSLRRPTVIAGLIAELPALLAAGGDAELRFDAIFGRNALGADRDLERKLEVVTSLLAAGGRLLLAESSRQQAQRLYQLLPEGALEAGLLGRVTAAEEAIYQRLAEEEGTGTDQAERLAGQLEALGLEQIAVESERMVAPVFIGKALLRRWFPEGEDGPASYAGRLRQLLSEEELAVYRGRFQALLADRTLNWHSTVIFARARRS